MIPRELQLMQNLIDKKQTPRRNFCTEIQNRSEDKDRFVEHVSFQK